MTAPEPRAPSEKAGVPQRLDPGTSAVIDVVSFGSGPVVGRLGKYDLVARLGQGGMAGVYLAVERGGVQDFRKLVVLKVLHESLRENENFVEMFMREAKIAADLAHPNVVHTYTVGENDGHYYLVMEYLDGVSLSAVLKKVRAWPLEKRLPLLGALCLALSGLHYVHEFHDAEGNHLGLVHRDFKPANIFITFDGQVKVLDFGVAKMTAPEVEETAGQAIKGTVQYISPEALDPRVKVDRRTDLFSAGLVAWEIAVGERLWGDRDHLQILRCLASGELPIMDDVVADLPDALFAMCHQAMSHLPTGRQSTALEFKRQIQAFLVRQGFRIDTEELGALVSGLFGPLHERRKATIREQLRILEERGEEITQEFVGSSPVLPLTENPSDTDIEGPGASPSLTELDVSPPAAWAETIAEPRRRRGALWVAVAVAAIAAVVLLVVMRQTEPSAAAEEAKAMTARSESAADANAEQPEAAGSRLDDARADGGPTQSDAAAVTVRVHAEPASAEILLDGEVLSGNPTEISGTDAEASHTLLVRADGFKAQESTLRLDISREVRVSLQPAEADADANRRKRKGKRAPSGAAKPPVASKSPAAASEPVAPKPKRPPRPGDDLQVDRTRKPISAIDEDIVWGN